MRRVLWLTVGFILLFSGAFYGVVMFKRSPYNSSYCCAQQGLYQQLGMKEEEKRAVLALDQEFIQEKNHLCMQLCQARYSLAQLLRQPEVTQKELEDKTTEISFIQLAMERAAVAHILKVRDTLTPSQAQKYMKMIYQDVCSDMNGQMTQSYTERK